MGIRGKSENLGKRLWESRKALCFAGYALAVSVLELLAYWREGIFSKAAFRLWMLSGLLCLLYFFWETAKQLLADLKNRSFFLLFGYLLVLGIYLFLIGNLSFSDISFEATQQAAAGLSSLKMPDGNYTKTGFLGYPNRQYVLAALPAALFGRSVLALHLGFALPFLIGMTALFLELRAWLRKKNWQEEAALLPVASLLTFPYIAEYYRFYEQTIHPVSFGMLGVALLLRLYRKTDTRGAFLTAWVGCMCCNLYTPALAFFGYLLVFLVLLGWNGLREYLRERKKDALETMIFSAAVVVCMCAFFAARQLIGGSADIGGIREGVSVSDVTWKAWIAFFLDLDGQFWGIHLGTAFLYLLLSLTGQLHFRDFLTAVWMLLTVSFARLFAGYTTYLQALENQRDMVLLPVVIVAVFFAAGELMVELSASMVGGSGKEAGYTAVEEGKNEVGRTFAGKNRKFRKKFRKGKIGIFAGAYAMLLFAGGVNLCREHQVFVYYRSVQPLKYAISYTKELLDEEGISDTMEFNWIIYTENRLIRNLPDYACFFWQNAHCFAPEAGELPKEPDASLPTILLAERMELLPEEIGFDEAVKRNADEESRTWKNPRYSSEVTWYRCPWAMEERTENDR